MKMPAVTGGHFCLPAKCGRLWPDLGTDLQEYTIRLTRRISAKIFGGPMPPAMHTLHTLAALFGLVTGIRVMMHTLSMTRKFRHCAEIFVVVDYFSASSSGTGFLSLDVTFGCYRALGTFKLHRDSLQSASNFIINNRARSSGSNSRRHPAG